MQSANQLWAENAKESLANNDRLYFEVRSLSLLVVLLLCELSR